MNKAVNCKKGHEPIFHKGRKCPLCQIMREKESLSRMIDNLQINLMFNEVEALLEVDHRAAFVARA